MEGLWSQAVYRRRRCRSICSRALYSDGSLDTSFNSNGKVTTAVGTGTCKGQGVALQDDGTIVVVGHSFKRRRPVLLHRVKVRRGRQSRHELRGTHGKVTTTVAKDSNADRCGDAERRKDCRRRQRVHRPATTMILGVVRYNANGTLVRHLTEPAKRLPTSALMTLATAWPCTAMEELLSPVTSTNESKKQCALAALKRMGIWTRVFNGTGRLPPISAATEMLKARVLATQSDGKTVVVGYATVSGVQRFAVERYKTDGALDTSFGGTGRVLTAVGISGSNAAGEWHCRRTAKLWSLGMPSTTVAGSMTLRVCAITLMGVLTKVSTITARSRPDVGEWQGQPP